MTVRELNREQLQELKGNYFAELVDEGTLARLLAEIMMSQATEIMRT